MQKRMKLSIVNSDKKMTNKLMLCNKSVSIIEDITSFPENDDIAALWTAINAIPGPPEKSEKAWEAPPQSEAAPESEEETSAQVTKLDFSLLDDMYAGKRAPDLTIVRINELEK